MCGLPRNVPKGDGNEAAELMEQNWSPAEPTQPQQQQRAGSSSLLLTYKTHFAWLESKPKISAFVPARDRSLS